MDVEEPFYQIVLWNIKKVVKQVLDMVQKEELGNLLEELVNLLKELEVQKKRQKVQDRQKQEDLLKLSKSQ